MTQGILSTAAQAELPAVSPLLLHQFFEEAARKWPARIAVDVPPGPGRPERRLTTYAQLARQADGVAAALGVIGSDSLVAILLPRDSARIYSAQLGVLQAGGAYTNLEPSLPDGRTGEILEDSQAVALLTDGAGAERAHSLGFARPILLAEELPDALPGVLPCPDPASLAYVIYTSGTTGRPKGVMIEHRSIVNLVAFDRAEFRLTPDDRVAQNSSAVYDSSVEETWLAFAAGATLVVADEHTLRLGPDLVAWLRREKITVISPTPTLLRSTGCARPDLELPDLRLVYVGGEAVPQDLADRWSKGRRMVNGYGPTECTVVATRAEIRPGEPVSIGQPAPGLAAYVLDEAIEEVAAGEWGELCIGGEGLARGYLHRPEQTAEKFVAHPRFGRIYRTGDLVHRAANGNLFYHGRADTQVKIRGYRIELEEIEMRLAEVKGVRSAACAVQEGVLVAFVAPEDDWPDEGFAALEASLREALPDYMVPGRFGILRELPLTAGGKLDRAALPRLDGPARTNTGMAARNARESMLAETVREVLGLSAPVPVDADFFTDLGGNSLRAAQLVTKLRERDASTAVTVRDVYEARTVAALAERMAPAIMAAPEEKVSGTRPSAMLATAVQAVWLLATFSLAALAAARGVIDGASEMLRHVGLAISLLLSPVLFYAGVAVYTPFAIGAAVLVKRCLIGRYRRLRAPVWGSFYVRNWMVQQTVRMVPWWLLEGTGFQTMALRALGARIGRRVHIHRGVNLVHGGWDLLEIGDDVTIGQEANLGLVELEDSEILVRPVHLGNGCTLETRAGVEGGARMEDGAQLTALSWLPPGGRVPAGERWDGIPAKAAGFAPSVPVTPPEISPVLHDFLLVTARAVCVSLPGTIPAFLAAVAALALGVDTEMPQRVLLAGLGLLVASMPLTLAAEAWMVRAMGRVPEDAIGLWSLKYLRVRMKTELLESSGHWLAGTLFWPVWLRWAGMKVGRGCEISSIYDTVPEKVEIGTETFLADGIYIGGPRIDRGTVTLAATRLGSCVFLGNHVVIPGGRSLPDNVLLGVCTVAGEAMENGRSWFGHPPFDLPRREVVACDRRLTLRPSAARYLTRLVWEVLRFGLPIPPALAGLWWLYVASTAGPAALCAAAIGAEGALLGLALAAKWVLLGKVRPGQHPFWACWCGRWDFVYMAWENWAHMTLVYLEGTLLLSWYLRAMGMKIGKRVVLGPGFAQVVDPDMLIVEDGATVSAMFQAHTFEDRVLKMDYVHVRRGATLGTASVPLYGADIGAGAYVAPHSVVMKDEHLLPGVRYAGAPAGIGAKGFSPQSHGDTEKNNVKSKARDHGGGGGHGGAG
jgi:non-ribosomal peptide synthetase-like protein